jgi:transcriptional regulator with XRE-family HTH domain
LFGNSFKLLSASRPIAAIDWETVGRRIRELRGFETSQEEFAKAIGVSQNHLSVMERGKAEIGAAILFGSAGNSATAWSGC